MIKTMLNADDGGTVEKMMMLQHLHKSHVSMMIMKTKMPEYGFLGRVGLGGFLSFACLLVTFCNVVHTMQWLWHFLHRVGLGLLVCKQDRGELGL